MIQDLDNAQDMIDEFDSKYRSEGKYVALNTTHRNTFELRIFKGSLKAKTLKATLQFCDNLARLVKESTLKEIQTLDFESIIEYNEYEELTQYWEEIKGEK